VVSLEPKPLALALDHQPGLAFAPPEVPSRPVPREKAQVGVADLPSIEPLDDVELTPANGYGPLRCELCERPLPARRVAKFCPHCGASQGVSRCPACRSAIEAGWRHCVDCGVALGRS
jgi:hypothetical protein